MHSKFKIGNHQDADNPFEMVSTSLINETLFISLTLKVPPLTHISEDNLNQEVHHPKNYDGSIII